MKICYLLVVLTQIVCVVLTLDESKNEENIKCTEFKETLDKNTLLHVPCLLIRLMEQLKLCPARTYTETFLTIKCSEKSGTVRKKLKEVKDRIMPNSPRSDLKRTRSFNEGRRLMQQLISSPASLVNKKLLDCRTFSYALRLYLEENQYMYALRRIFILNKNIQDESLPLYEEKIDRQLNTLKCRDSIKTDQSFFYYIKYLIESFKFLVSESVNSQTILMEKQQLHQLAGGELAPVDDKVANRLDSDSQSSGSSKSELLTMIENESLKNITTSPIYLNVHDVVQLFYPYVEVTNRFKRILPSHSYLSYFMLNYETLFNSNSSCTTKNTSEDESKGPRFLKKIRKFKKPSS